MEWTLRCGGIEAAVESLGAQLLHLRYGSREYLWQGDPRYWQRRAPLLFPFIGRLPGGRYFYNGQYYPMCIHGFLSHQTFTAVRQGPEELCLTYFPDEQVRTVYPFYFRFTASYRLLAAGLRVTLCVENLDDVPLHFALGSHPGFRVPLENGLLFEDYCLAFSPSAAPQRVLFDSELLATRGRAPLPLTDGRLPLHHGLFAQDAIVLEHSGSQVRLFSPRGRHGLQLQYSGFPYLGLWQRPHTDAPYLCIEPWSALPGYAESPLAPAARPDFFHLPPGQLLRRGWTVTLF